MTPPAPPKGTSGSALGETQHREAGQPDSRRLLDTGPSLTLMWETQ